MGKPAKTAAGDFSRARPRLDTRASILDGSRHALEGSGDGSPRAQTTHATDGPLRHGHSVLPFTVAARTIANCRPIEGSPASPASLASHFITRPTEVSIKLWLCFGPARQSRAAMSVQLNQLPVALQPN